MTKKILILILLTGCSPIVRNDTGGSVVDYAIQAAEPRKIDGRCMSACTLYLSNPQTCITPRASFHFHRPYSTDPKHSATAQAFMMKLYPSWVVRWINARGGLTNNWLVMKYEEAAPYVNRC